QHAGLQGHHGAAAVQGRADVLRGTDQGGGHRDPEATRRPPASHPRKAASDGVAPPTSAARKAPSNASPAPVVSSSSASTDVAAATRVAVSPSRTRAPWRPRFTHTMAYRPASGANSGPLARTPASRSLASRMVAGRVASRNRSTP